jgi:hypothetical protein
MDDQPAALAETIIKVETISPLPDNDQPEDGDLNSAQESFKSLLKLYINDLLADLGLKTTIKLDVVWIAGEPEPNSKARAVFVNGRECRVPFVSSLPLNPMKSRSLAGWAVEMIAANFELLLPLSFSNSLREAWSSKSKSCLSLLQADAFNMLLVSLARRGYSVERVRQVAGKLDAPESQKYTLAEVFNQAVEISERSPAVIVSDAIAAKSADPDSRKSSVLKDIRDTIFYDLGIPIRTVDFDVDPQLKDSEFRIRINDVRSVPRELFTETPPDDSSTTDPWEQILHTAVWIAKTLAGNLLTMRLLDQQVDLLRQRAPDLVDLASRSVDKQLLFEILQDLLDEEVSIRDLRRIFEGLVSLNGATKVDQAKYIVFAPNTANFVPVDNAKQLEELDLIDYSNWVRLALNRSISNQFVRGGNTLIVYLLDPAMEARLRRAPKDPLSAEETKRLHDVIYQELSTPWIGHDAVILTTMEVRRPLSQLIKLEFPQLAVLGYQELSADLNIQPIARISWPEQAN